MLPFSAVWSDRNDNPVLRRFLSLSRAHLKTLVRETAAAAAAGPGRPTSLRELPIRRHEPGKHRPDQLRGF